MVELCHFGFLEVKHKLAVVFFFYLFVCFFGWMVVFLVITVNVNCHEILWTVVLLICLSKCVWAVHLIQETIVGDT